MLNKIKKALLGKKKVTTVIAEAKVKSYDCKNYKDAIQGKKPKRKGCESTCDCTFKMRTQSEIERSANGR